VERQREICGWRKRETDTCGWRERERFAGGEREICWWRERERLAGGDRERDVQVDKYRCGREILIPMLKRG